jgi:hypothetical protein
MSVQAIAWVLEHSESRLGARHVMISIANHAKADGTGAWPSITTIAHESRLSEREVQLSIRKLVATGELCVEQGAGPHGTNLYSLPLVAARGEKFAPLGGEKPSMQGVKNPTNAGEKFSPEPSLIQPSLEPSNVLTLTPTPLPYELPVWIPREAWEAFVQMRKKIGYPLTDYAVKLAVRNLDKLRGQGESLEDVLNQSILNCWRGLFPVKGNGYESNRPSFVQERERRSHDAILRGVNKALERATRTASGGIPDRTK